jgi:hypothetical protein
MSVASAQAFLESCARYHLLTAEQIDALTIVQRFHRDIRAAARLDHPVVIRNP